MIRPGKLARNRIFSSRFCPGRRSTHMKLTIRPLTPSMWPAFEALFGNSGTSNGCWCMYWRIGSEYHKRPREKNKSAFHRIVNHGPPPGLLAFDGEQAVGWCQLTPRQDLRWLNCKPVLESVDDAPVLDPLVFLCPAWVSQTRHHGGSDC